MLLESSYYCAYCGEHITTTVDASAGSQQLYIEDCSVCCRPNTLRIEVDPESQTVRIDASFDG